MRTKELKYWFRHLDSSKISTSIRWKFQLMNSCSKVSKQKLMLFLFFVIHWSGQAQTQNIECLDKLIQEKIDVMSYVYEEDTLIFAIVAPELLFYSQGQYELEKFLLSDIMPYDFSFGPFQMKKAFILTYDDNSDPNFKAFLEIENQINLMHVYIEKTSHHSTREKIQLYNSGKIGTDYRFKSLKCYEMTYFEISKYLMTHMKALRMYR
jgi:hypothetical protein